jgi:hypothetical protein
MHTMRSSPSNRILVVETHKSPSRLKEIWQTNYVQELNPTASRPRPEGLSSTGLFKRLNSALLES